MAAEIPRGRLFTALAPDEQKKPPRPLAKHRYLIHDPGKIMMLPLRSKEVSQDVAHKMSNSFKGLEALTVVATD